MCCKSPPKKQHNTHTTNNPHYTKPPTYTPQSSPNHPPTPPNHPPTTHLNIHPTTDLPARHPSTLFPSLHPPHPTPLYPTTHSLTPTHSLNPPTLLHPAPPRPTHTSFCFHQGRSAHPLRVGCSMLLSDLNSCRRTLIPALRPPCLALLYVHIKRRIGAVRAARSKVRVCYQLGWGAPKFAFAISWDGALLSSRLLSAGMGRS